MGPPSVLDIPTPPRQAVALFITFFFPAVAWTTFLARVWSRLRITRCWGCDDWLMLPAAICSLFFTPFFYMYMKLGYFGWHQQDVPADFDPSPGLFYFYIAQLFYNPILAFVKCSILVFILHIGRTRKGLPWMVYSVITLTALHAIAVFFAVLLSCVPIAAIWTPSLKPQAKCIDNSFHVTISGITVLTDLMVLALPFYVFLGLQMRRGTRIAVLCCFGLGAVVTAVSIARIVSLVQLFYFPTGGDPFYDIKITYSIVEPNVAIATACAPALRPLLKHYFSSVFGSPSTSGTYGESYGTASAATHGAHKAKLQKDHLTIALQTYGQKARRKDGHEELASIASSQDKMV